MKFCRMGMSCLYDLYGAGGIYRSGGNRAADSFEKKMTEIFRGAQPFTLLEEVYWRLQEGELSLQSND